MFNSAEELTVTLKLKKKHYEWLLSMAEKDGCKVDDGVSIMVAMMLESNKSKIKKGLR